MDFDGRKPGLRRQDWESRIEDRCSDALLLAGVIIRLRRDSLRRFECQQRGLRLEAVEIFTLVDAVDQPVCRREFVVEWIGRAEAEMVKRQKVEEIRPAIIEIVFGVVGFVTERAGEFAEINCQAGAQRRNVSSVNLPDVAINLRPQFVDSAALQGFGRLAELQVESRSESAPGVYVRRLFQDDRRLVQAEAVAQYVIGAQQVDAAEWAVEIVGVISVNS